MPSTKPYKLVLLQTPWKRRNMTMKKVHMPRQALRGMLP
jgi:hypothetical protein